MDDKLKYRLVGAALIFAIMAFFLPLILDSEKYRTKIDSQIPAMPDSSQQDLAGSDVAPVKEISSEQGTLKIDLSRDPNEIQAREANASEANPVANEPNQEVPQDAAKKTSSEAVKDAEPAESKKETKKETEKVTVGIVKKPAEKTPVIAEPVKEETKEVTKQEVKAEVKPVAKPIIKPDFKEKAYVIQIGTFSNKENASKLVAQLRAEDYRAYQRLDKDYSRVYVGPYPDEKIAKQRSSSLAKLVGNSVKVIEFDPIAH